MELIKEDVPTEDLEVEFIQLWRRSAITARGARLAEEMMKTADERHQKVQDRLVAVDHALEARYFAAASSIGVEPDEQAPVVKLEE